MYTQYAYYTYFKYILTKLIKFAHIKVFPIGQKQLKHYVITYIVSIWITCNGQNISFITCIGFVL